MKINGSTQLYGIIGWPVKHSLSLLFQASFLEQKKVNAVYLPFAVDPGRLSQAVEGLYAVGVEGFNVTIPHKESLFHMVSADSDASVIGAVNTVRRSANGWEAMNTDWRGFMAVVEGLGAPMQGKSALMFGAGGTARAVLHALSALGLRNVYICNRNADRLSDFIKAAKSNYPNMEISSVAWKQQAVTAACDRVELLVNSTSIGLESGQQFPFTLSGKGMAVDVVYQPSGDTAFCRALQGSPYIAVDGLPMLIAQGAESFAWWHDCERPDLLTTLRDVETQLGRRATMLSGWEEQ